MTETERLALSAAFLAAMVAVGLALSLVPHVELVTLTAFTAGLLLGARAGALIGAAGMLLYTFANSAVHGFPPSPLPVLATQMLGMAITGGAGALWRRAWLRGRAPRRGAMLALPAIGFLLAALDQALLNGAYAWFLGSGEATRTAAFVSGMLFGLLDMIWNAAVFAVGGPVAATVLRREARRRGWWREARAGLVVVVVAGALVVGARSQAAPVPSDPLEAAPGGAGRGRRVVALPDTVFDHGPVDTFVPAPPDTVVVDTLLAPSLRDTAAAAVVDTVEVPLRPPPPGTPLRPLALRPAPVWQPLDVAAAAPLGVTQLQDTDVFAGAARSWTTAPALPSVLDAWGLGWGRVRYSYDGVPMAGPVHDFGEPPDLPLAWRAGWRERWTASGTRVDVASPPPAEGSPLSQISLTSGSLGRRTAEFALFRNLGPVNVGVDFRDREEALLDALGGFLSGTAAGDRLWLRVESIAGRRPDWSVDVAGGEDKRTLSTGQRLNRLSRRLQTSLNGPFLGGATRLTLALRRQALQLSGGAGAFGEIIFDGGTAQADWAAPVPGLTLRARFDRDRRRGGLDPSRTLDGERGEASWSGSRGGVRLGAEASAGHQEPYGNFAEGALVAGYERGSWGLRLAASREVDLPPLVLDVDRPAPEAGVSSWLERYETAERPETRNAVRAEAGWKGGWAALAAGMWAARITGYRIDSNPLWVPLASDYAPVFSPGTTGDVQGLYARFRVNAGTHLFGEGEGRTQNRDDREVPYLPAFSARGALHWRRLWFKRSLDLDASIGGALVGPRRNPNGALYPTTAVGYARLTGRIDNGLLILGFQNLGSIYMESDLRSNDTVTPLPIPGQTVLLGLTMYLRD